MAYYFIKLNPSSYSWSNRTEINSIFAIIRTPYSQLYKVTDRPLQDTHTVSVIYLHKVKKRTFLLPLLSPSHTVRTGNAE